MKNNYLLYKLTLSSLYYYAMDKICPFMINDMNNVIRNIICYEYNKINIDTITNNERYNGFKIDKPKLITKPEKIKLIDLSDLNKYKDFINKSILHFSNVIEDFNFTAYNNFINNANKLFITDYGYNDIKDLGFYSHKSNKEDDLNLLYIDTNKSKKTIQSTIYHELMHMSSTTRYNNILYSGFHIYDKNSNSSIGLILNECATDIICDRLFENYKSSYPDYMIDMTNKIIDIVGFDKFSNYYFESDLPSLINDINNYIDIDFKNIIVKMDDIYTINNLDNANKIILRLLTATDENNDKNYIECNNILNNALNKKNKTI